MIYFFFTLVFLPLILDKNKNKTASLKFSFFILFFLLLSNTNVQMIGQDIYAGKKY